MKRQDLAANENRTHDPQSRNQCSTAIMPLARNIAHIQGFNEFSR